MHEPFRQPGRDHVALLRRISARIRQGETPSQAQIEETLEHGFGQLMGLEAELLAAQRAGHRNGELEHLQESIEILREALHALRLVSGPPGPPRIGYGFVLPDTSRP